MVLIALSLFRFVFLCNRWLAVDRDDGQIERLLPVATAEDLKKFHFLFQATTRKDMTDEHLWFSLACVPLINLCFIEEAMKNIYVHKIYIYFHKIYVACPCLL